MVSHLQISGKRLNQVAFLPKLEISCIEGTEHSSGRGWWMGRIDAYNSRCLNKSGQCPRGGS